MTSEASCHDSSESLELGVCGGGLSPLPPQVGHGAAALDFFNSLTKLKLFRATSKHSNLLHNYSIVIDLML